MSSNYISLEQLGKFPLLDRLAQPFKTKHSSSIHGIGEDAAVVDAGSHYQLITSHLLVEGTHFDLTYCPLKHLGYKAVVMHIADVIAMNGIAEQLQVNLAASSKFPVEALEALYAGIQLACEQYQVDLVGMDMHATASGLLIATTAVGKVDKAKISLRKGAATHDIICVTGDLGAAYLGLQALNREKQVFQADPQMQPDLTPYQYLVERQLKPEVRVDILQSLAQLAIVPTAMMNITDGLAAALLHISKWSQAGVRIYEERLPIHQLTYATAVAFHLDPIMCAVNGGEDYELLFTISQKDVVKLENHPNISLIGHITDISQGANLITSGGSQVPLTAPGWQPSA